MLIEFIILLFVQMINHINDLMDLEFKIKLNAFHQILEYLNKYYDKMEFEEQYVLNSKVDL